MKTFFAILFGAALAVFFLAPKAFPVIEKKRPQKPSLKIVSSK